MNHARVKALKGNGGKTTSRKAIKSGRASGAVTPQGGSPMASLLTSPTHSNTASRVASDISDEDDSDFEVDDMMSLHSGGSMSEYGDDEPTINFNVTALLDGIQDRKHNNNEVREQYLEAFIKVMRGHYNAETHLWLDDAAPKLTETFLKGANRSTSAKERLLNLQSYCLTVGTVEDMEIFESADRAIKQILVDDDDDNCQVWAIYALCMTVLYAGGMEESALEVMEYLIDIVQSDGESIESHDNGSVVAAALFGWLFVAGHVDDFSEYADTATDAFVEQLDSNDVEVQSNAGACIALVFECSRAHEQDTGKPFQLPYDPAKLSGRLSELAKSSAKSVSRRDRRDLRESLVSVVTSLERGVGPYYSTALYIPEKDDHVPVQQRNDDGQAEYGYRYKLRLGGHVTRVNTWSLYARVTMLKILFRGGLEKHVFVNPVVTECLDDAEWSQDSNSHQRKRK